MKLNTTGKSMRMPLSEVGRMNDRLALPGATRAGYLSLAEMNRKTTARKKLRATSSTPTYN
jgi:hypothetical protein